MLQPVIKKKGPQGSAIVIATNMVLRHWGDVINNIRLLGKTYIVTRHDRPVAVIVPVEKIDALLESTVFQIQRRFKLQDKAGGEGVSAEERKLLLIELRRTLGLPDEKLEEPEKPALGVDGVYLPEGGAE